jgi:hypothetical protein
VNMKALCAILLSATVGVIIVGVILTTRYYIDDDQGEVPPLLGDIFEINSSELSSSSEEFIETTSEEVYSEIDDYDSSGDEAYDSEEEKKYWWSGSDDNEHRVLAGRDSDDSRLYVIRTGRHEDDRMVIGKFAQRGYAYVYSEGREKGVSEAALAVSISNESQDKKLNVFGSLSVLACEKLLVEAEKLWSNKKSVCK